MRLLGSIGKRLAAKPTLQTDHRWWNCSGNSACL